MTRFWALFLDLFFDLFFDPFYDRFLTDFQSRAVYRQSDGRGMGTTFYDFLRFFGNLSLLRS